MYKEVPKMAGRSDIASWIAGRLEVKMDGLQELGTGHIYCLLLNSYHPKTIGEALINLTPHNEHQYVHNLKLFQFGLNKLRCKRRIDIDKLSKMKFQENWETISWLKRFLQQGSKQKENQAQKEKSQRKEGQNANRQAEKEEGLTFDFGQLFRQPLSAFPTISNSGQDTPLGKASITSNLIQNNYIALIDRIKEVVSSNESEGQKLRLLEMLLNVPSKQLKERKIDSEISQLVE